MKLDFHCDLVKAGSFVSMCHSQLKTINWRSNTWISTTIDLIYVALFKDPKHLSLNPVLIRNASSGVSTSALGHNYREIWTANLLISGQPALILSRTRNPQNPNQKHFTENVPQLLRYTKGSTDTNSLEAAVKRLCQNQDFVHAMKNKAMIVLENQRALKRMKSK